MNILGWVETALQDLRYAGRTLRKNPGFTAVAMIALALGISANSAMFSVVYAVMLKPLPYVEPQRLVWLTDYVPGFQTEVADSCSYDEWRANPQIFENAAAFNDVDFNLVGTGQPERLHAAAVSASFFPTLGISPAMGRGFTAEEDHAGGPHAAILTHSLFARRFGANPAIIGKTVDLDDTLYSIVGVLPPKFRLPEPVDIDLLVPLAIGPQTQEDGFLALRTIARMRPGISVERVRRDLDTVRKRRVQAGDTRSEVRVTPLHQHMVGDSRTALLVLLGAVGLVLLIACGNVANLLLGRATARRREIAVRAALGAARSQLVRQFLAESLLLSLTGAGLGLVLAKFAIQTLIRLAFAPIPLMEQTSNGWAVLAFTAGTAILTGLAFGILPAMAAANSGILETLKHCGITTTASSTHRRFRGLLVIAEIGLTLVLLVGSGLLIKSLWILDRQDPGFNPEHVISADTNPLASRFNTPAKQRAFFEDALERIRGVPGVESAGVYDENIGGILTILGQPVLAGRTHPWATYYTVSPGFFTAMGARVKRGRMMNELDSATAPLVVNVNATLARRYLAGTEAVGKQVKFGRMFTIVGVVDDLADRALDGEAQAVVFVPLAQSAFVPSMHLVVRSAAEPAVIEEVIRDRVRSIDRDQPVFNVRTMQQKLAASIAPRRFNMILLSLFAGLALVLAIVGIYAVMFASVSEREREVGIRMALGAKRQDVLKLIAGHGARLVIAGLAIGIAGSWAATRLLKTMLYGVSTTDLWTFSVVPLLLAAVAMIASLIPVIRATRVDPVVALRLE